MPRRITPILDYRLNRTDGASPPTATWSFRAVTLPVVVNGDLRERADAIFDQVASGEGRPPLYDQVFNDRAKRAMRAAEGVHTVNGVTYLNGCQPCYDAVVVLGDSITESRAKPDATTTCATCGTTWRLETKMEPIR